jgi:hypothetical protein
MDHEKHTRNWVIGKSRGLIVLDIIGNVSPSFGIQLIISEPFTLFFKSWSSASVEWSKKSKVHRKKHIWSSLTVLSENVPVYLKRFSLKTRCCQKSKCIWFPSVCWEENQENIWWLWNENWKPSLSP